MNCLILRKVIEGNKFSKRGGDSKQLILSLESDFALLSVWREWQFSILSITST